MMTIEPISARRMCLRAHPASSSTVQGALPEVPGYQRRTDGNRSDHQPTGPVRRGSVRGFVSFRKQSWISWFFTAGQL